MEQKLDKSAKAAPVTEPEKKQTSSKTYIATGDFPKNYKVLQPGQKVVKVTVPPKGLVMHSQANGKDEFRIEISPYFMQKMQTQINDTLRAEVLAEKEGKPKKN